MDEGLGLDRERAGYGTNLEQGAGEVVGETAVTSGSRIDRAGLTNLLCRRKDDLGKHALPGERRGDVTRGDCSSTRHVESTVKEVLECLSNHKADGQDCFSPLIRASQAQFDKFQKSDGLDFNIPSFQVEQAHILGAHVDGVSNRPSRYTLGWDPLSPPSTGAQLSAHMQPDLSPESARSGGAWYNFVDSEGQVGWAWSPLSLQGQGGVPHQEGFPRSPTGIEMGEEGEEVRTSAGSSKVGSPSVGCTRGQLKSIIISSLVQSRSSPIAEGHGSLNLGRRNPCSVVLAEVPSVQSDQHGVFPCMNEVRDEVLVKHDVGRREGVMGRGQLAHKQDISEGVGRSLAEAFIGSPACRKAPRMGVQGLGKATKDRFKDFISDDQFESTRLDKEGEEAARGAGLIRERVKFGEHVEYPYLECEGAE
ncbi:hypothetical protein QJS10_CPB21g01156 [Acorus calamus]|uniref:Uncharacterized protein n=1 Tax=Acorus calamus TaxID=4465 RepID=A0AAV9C6F2_ACOCL|nr:hypothetical protein QJS10_CPB21g01156 [Acorus calamus]